MKPPRSWLYAPGHSERVLARVFEAGADEVILDLEDAVPDDLKQAARAAIARVLATQSAWVRINPAQTRDAEADLVVVAARARGIRVPKVESPDDIRWVASRAPGALIAATIESARGLLAAPAIAVTPGVTMLVYGGTDLALDLGIDPRGREETVYARSSLVAAARAAGLPGPCDGAWTQIADEDGLRAEAQMARRLGFSGKSAVHPRQLPAIHAAFAASRPEVAWARRVLEVFERGGGAVIRTEDGEMVDAPVAERARRILES